jgi:prevent-host-death family protein
MVMTIVRIADLKARLSEYLRRVRRGEVLTVLDRQTPIARIVPHDDGRHRLTVRHPAADTPAPPRVPVPPPLKVDVDVVSLLLEERQGGR